VRLTAPLLLLCFACTDDEDGEPDKRSDVPVVTFGFPIADRSLIDSVIGVDHDPEVHDENLAAAAICYDHEGEPFPACYDEHDGTDYLLDGGFDTMDAGSVEIVAAAPGTVVDTADGNYDRCHATLEGVSCDGHEMKANYVILEHDYGIRTLYWHMMKNSVAVEVGDEVACGDVLGIVGSSGISSTPHLHFEVQRSDHVSFDPYSGEFSQDLSWWDEQETDDGLPEDGCTAL